MFRLNSKITVLILSVVLLSLVTGCQKGWVDPGIEDPLLAANNVTNWDDLVIRASKIETFKYTLQDTDFPEGYEYFVRGRHIKINLPDVRTEEDGNEYNAIFLDRVTKEAFTWCNYDLCEAPIDRSLVRTNYSEYYHFDPLEELYRVNEAEFVGNEMIGENIVKVFDIEYKGKPGRAWVQEHYGYPISIKYEKEDGSVRTIFFEELMVDNVRFVDVFPPFNYSVDNVLYPTPYHYFKMYPFNSWNPRSWPGQNHTALDLLEEREGKEERIDVTDQLLN